MSIDITTPWGAVINGVLSVINKVIPDPAAKAAAQLQVLTLEQNGDLAELKASTELALAQINVNNTEAQSTSFFRSGWRPFAGWICGTGLGVQFLVAPLFTWLAALVGHPTAFPTLDIETLMTLLFGMLGLGTMRTSEKMKGIP